MKFLLAFILVFSGYIISFSQENNSFIQPCGQNEMLEYQKQNRPGFSEEYEESRLILEEETKNHTLKSGTTYTIPVVFHILYENESGNISNAQIFDAVKVLNEDFRKGNSDADMVMSQFLDLVANVNIEFELATIAPDGSCFKGITRTQTAAGNGGDMYAQISALVNGNDVYQGVWTPQKYLNILVCEKLYGNVQGYTTLPSGTPNSSENSMSSNAIYMSHEFTGSIGTSNPINSRVLTHEMGHWLNLYHIWGPTNQPGVQSNCDVDDLVEDTPNTVGWGNCNLGTSSCGSMDNIENYMDYAPCRRMFTLGQAQRMRAAAESSVGGRKNLWKEANLLEVGAVPGASICRANIKATPHGVCAGSSTVFSVDGLDATILTYNWSFPGGSPASSTDSNPTVTYSTPGIYDASVSITTSSDSRGIEEIDFLTVVLEEDIGPVTSLPVSEGFEGASFPPANWTIDNGGQSSTWQQSNKGTAPTPSNSASIRFKGGANTDGDIDDLNSTAFTLEDFASATLAFDVAYRYYYIGSYSFYDKLQVLVSPGCGMEYELVYFKEKDVLQTEEPATSSSPGYTNPTQWRNETIDLTPYVGYDKVKVKFRAISGNGSTLYIDNVNITGEESPDEPDDEEDDTSGIDKQDLAHSIHVYPNPTNGVVTIQSEEKLDDIIVMDELGRIVKRINNNETKVVLDLSSLSKGNYFVKCLVGERLVNFKIVVM